MNLNVNTKKNHARVQIFNLQMLFTSCYNQQINMPMKNCLYVLQNTLRMMKYLVFSMLYTNVKTVSQMKVAINVLLWLLI